MNESELDIYMQFGRNSESKPWIYKTQVKKLTVIPQPGGSRLCEEEEPHCICIALKFCNYMFIIYLLHKTLSSLSSWPIYVLLFIHYVSPVLST